MNNLSCRYPLVYFLIFICFVLGAYIYYQPSWGLMDDWQFIQQANNLWGSDHVLGALYQNIKEDFAGGKMRPIHNVYVFFVYYFFQSIPSLIYILIFIFLMASLPVWGMIFHRAYVGDDPISYDHLFLFPLTFFIFTPFWNNFMYISLQEKLIFFFSTISVYFFIKTYKHNQIQHFLYTFIFAVLCLLSKPTGIYLMVSYFVFSVIHLVFFRKQRKLSLSWLFLSLMTVGLYYWHMKSSVTGGYSLKYVKNFNISTMINHLWQASMIVKILLFMSFCSLSLSIIKTKQSKLNPLTMFVPIAYIVYISILTPWQIINYFLAPIAPFVLGLFFPVYLKIKSALKNTSFRFVPNVGIILLTMIVVWQIIIPRISKMADIKNVKKEILILKNGHINPLFFFPPPYVETRYALKKFMDINIKYLAEGILTADMVQQEPVYLIYRDECASIKLQDVKLGDVVYKNNTWKIFKVLKAPGEEKRTNVEFPKTFLQRLVSQSS